MVVCGFIRREAPFTTLNALRERILEDGRVTEEALATCANFKRLRADSFLSPAASAGSSAPPPSDAMESPALSDSARSSWIITADTSYADQDALDRRGTVMAEVVLELGSDCDERWGGDGADGGISDDRYSDTRIPREGKERKTLLTGQRADGTKYSFMLEDMPPWFGVRSETGGWFVKSSLPGRTHSSIANEADLFCYVLHLMNTTDLINTHLPAINSGRARDVGRRRGRERVPQCHQARRGERRQR